MLSNMSADFARVYPVRVAMSVAVHGTNTRRVFDQKARATFSVGSCGVISFSDAPNVARGNGGERRRVRVAILAALDDLCTNPRTVASEKTRSIDFISSMKKPAPKGWRSVQQRTKSFAVN